MESLKNKNILIVGATGGIGSQLAKLLAGSGANLFLTGRNHEKLAEIAASIGISPDKTFAADISRSGDVAELKKWYFTVN